jgi:neurexin
MRMPSLPLFLLFLGLLNRGGSSFVLEGSQTSYAQFRKWYSDLNSNLEFEFLTAQPNGLLLYTDDGGYYDFLEIKMVEAGLRIRLNLGNGAQIVDMGRGLNDGLTWHKVQIRRNGTKTVVRLDNKIESVLPDDSKFRPTSSVKVEESLKRNLYFGNFSSNSDIYVGGLPSWYATKLSSLALPSVVFEPRFRGSIRNIVYADEESGRPRRQEVMAYKVSSKPQDFYYYLLYIYSWAGGGGGGG